MTKATVYLIKIKNKKIENINFGWVCDVDEGFFYLLLKLTKPTVFLVKTFLKTLPIDI